MDPILALVEIPKISLAAEELFHIGPLKFTNSNLMMFIVMIGLSIFLITSTRKLSVVPGRRQAFVELIVESLRNFVVSTSGNPRLSRNIYPLMTTLFLFIICANYSGLLPGVGNSIVVHHEVAVPAAEVAEFRQLTPTERETRHIVEHDGNLYEREDFPLLRSPNADLNMTLAMAIIIVVLVQIVGIQTNGVGGYLSEFKNPLAIVEVFSRILSLSMRLFGNVFGGEVLVTVMYALTYAFVPAFFLAIEIFFGGIQAFVFITLSTIYLALAATAHHGGHDAAQSDAHGEHHGEGLVTEGAAAPLAGGD